MICVEQAIILSTDAAKARARARSYMKNYVPWLPSYLNNLKNLGWADVEFENGCSDKLVDAIVAWRSEKQIEDRIEAHLKAGATHVCIQPLHPDNDAHPDLKAVEALARLNKPLGIDPRAAAGVLKLTDFASGIRKDSGHQRWCPTP
jgi:alkanesulfonate monooxygenase SsuD/methylene tetrahydromethanopterin reductase-like flavin-dependent oxidoreductase (luciferase family)